MILFLSVAIVFCFVTISFSNAIIYQSIDNRFYSSLKSACENSISYNGVQLYFNKAKLKSNLQVILNKNLSKIAHKYKLYVTLCYQDGNACQFKCKVAYIRLEIDISSTSTFDKAYYMTIGQNNG